MSSSSSAGRALRQDDARAGRTPFTTTPAMPIPWYVRGIWIVFWCFAITYVVALAASRPPVANCCRPHELGATPYRGPATTASLPCPRAGGAAPAARRRAGRRSTRLYCCLGCRMAAAIVQEKGEAGAVAGHAHPAGPVDLLHDERHGVHHGALDRPTSTRPPIRRTGSLASMHGLFRYVVLLFSLPVLLLLGSPAVRATPGGTCGAGSLSTDALLSPRASRPRSPPRAVSVLRGERPDLLRGRLRRSW